MSAMLVAWLWLICFSFFLVSLISFSRSFQNKNEIEACKIFVICINHQILIDFFSMSDADFS